METMRNSRAEAIAEYIGEQFIRVRWKPGDRVDDNELAKELGVSRNSVREALERLVAINAIDKRQWIGYFVPVIDLSYAVETLTIRRDLEVLALQLFLERPISSDDIRTMRNAIDKSEKDFLRNDWDAFLSSDYIIHKLIQQRCGNRWVPKLLHQTSFTVSQIQYLDRESNQVEYARRSIGEHREMLKLIEEGKKQEAVNLLAEHLSFQIERISSLLK